MSNRLPAIAADLVDLHRDIERHSMAAADKAITAGRLLIEAKILAGHGGWRAFLAQAGLPIRTAQRYMRLSASPLNATLVTHLGGITAALAFLSKWTMPAPGEALHIMIGEGDDEDFAFIWEDQDAPGHFVIAAVVKEQCVATKRPMQPLIEIDGEQPVDTILSWLDTNGLHPSADWQVSMVDLELARMVIDPLLAVSLLGFSLKPFPA